jgi:hypothetical protein
VKRPDSFTTRLAGALGYNDTYYNAPALPSPAAAVALTGTAGAAAGHLGGFAVDDYVSHKRDLLEEEEKALKGRGDKLRKDKQFVLEVLKMLGGGKYIDKNGVEQREPYVWSKRLALAGGLTAAAPAAVMAGSYAMRGHNPFSREAAKWDENYTRPDPKVNMKMMTVPKIKTGHYQELMKQANFDRVSGLAPLPKEVFYNDLYSNPYMNYGKKQKIEGVVETASGGGGLVAPLAFGVLNAMTGGSFGAGVLGGAIISHLTNQPKKTKIDLQIDGTYNKILNTVF